MNAQVGSIHGPFLGVPVRLQAQVKAKPISGGFGVGLWDSRLQVQNNIRASIVLTYLSGIMGNQRLTFFRNIRVI